MADTTHLSATDRSAAEKAVLAVTNRSMKASEQKDLDGAMEMIADDVVSFEHDAPLMYQGADAVREVCRRGIEMSGDDLKLAFKPLRIIVRDDIAVVWGFNSMKSSDGDFWSRATRVFQNVDGEWKAIHQHLSFPYDPESGEVKTDLKPD
jgi:ketosteroid isomerase-like protein